MVSSHAASLLLADEARALLARLSRVQFFALHESMVPAAMIAPAALTAIEQYLATGRRQLRGMIHSFLGWLEQGEGRAASPHEAQRRYTFLRLRFNTTLDQYEIFSSALTQRSEQDYGVWLSGLDVAAADALALPEFYEAPPVICYLDRGFGAAIRRARTRLPGGGENPVAVIRIPRERMVGAGIASSLVHEVGHQVSALLDLIPAIQPALGKMAFGSGPYREAWRLWYRWISEILSDFWSVGQLGIGSTLGLMGVVSLPRAFVFRIGFDDPHPVPWVRVRLSCALGDALYPHPQWRRLAAMWNQFYPLEGLDPVRRGLVVALDQTMPRLAVLLVNHRPPALRGRSLGEVLPLAERRPEHLARHFDRWQVAPARMWDLPPSLSFAIIGQARADGRIVPEMESRFVNGLLRHWALRRTLDATAGTTRLPAAPIPRAS